MDTVVVSEEDIRWLSSQGSRPSLGLIMGFRRQWTRGYPWRWAVHRRYRGQYWTLFWSQCASWLQPFYVTGNAQVQAADSPLDVVENIFRVVWFLISPTRIQHQQMCSLRHQPRVSLCSPWSPAPGECVWSFLVEGPFLRTFVVDACLTKVGRQQQDNANHDAADPDSLIAF